MSGEQRAIELGPLKEICLLVIVCYHRDIFFDSHAHHVVNHFPLHLCSTLAVPPSLSSASEDGTRLNCSGKASRNCRKCPKRSRNYQRSSRRRLGKHFECGRWTSSPLCALESARKLGHLLCYLLWRKKTDTVLFEDLHGFCQIGSRIGKGVIRWKLHLFG